MRKNLARTLVRHFTKRLIIRTTGSFPLNRDARPPPYPWGRRIRAVNVAPHVSILATLQHGVVQCRVGLTQRLRVIILQEDEQWAAQEENAVGGGIVKHVVRPVFKQKIVAAVCVFHHSSYSIGFICRGYIKKAETGQGII